MPCASYSRLTRSRLSTAAPTKITERRPKTAGAEDHPGDDQSAEITRQRKRAERLRRELDEQYDADLAAAVASAEATIAELGAIPHSPERTVWVPVASGIPVARHWATLDKQGQARFLRDWGVVVHANKAGTDIRLGWHEAHSESFRAPGATGPAELACELQRTLHDLGRYTRFRLVSGISGKIIHPEPAALGALRRASVVRGDRWSPPRPPDEAERMTGGVGIDVFVIEPRRTEFQGARAGRGHVLHHDVQVHLLRHGRIRPRRRPVVARELECQARCRIVGSNHNPVVALIGDRLSQQFGVERRERRRVGAVEHHMVQPSDHDCHGDRYL